MDTERLERIKDQARKAATEGIAGALEAVEQAIRNLGVSKPPKTPAPPTPPSSPTPPVPPTPSPAPGQTLRTGTEESSSVATFPIQALQQPLSDMPWNKGVATSEAK